jgi:hypothetical protein
MEWYDVHFQLNGFVKMQAETKEEACRLAERMLNQQLPDIEGEAHTGLSVEITEAVKE